MPDGLTQLPAPGAPSLPPPQGAPMAGPAPKEGLQARSKVDIQQAVALLKKNLSPEIFPVHGPEWKALDSAIRGLEKIVGEEQGQELGQAGLKLIASTMSPKGLAGIMGGAMPGMKPQGPGGIPMMGM